MIWSLSVVTAEQPGATLLATNLPLLLTCDPI